MLQRASFSLKDFNFLANLSSPLLLTNLKKNHEAKLTQNPKNSNPGDQNRDFLYQNLHFQTSWQAHTQKKKTAESKKKLQISPEPEDLSRDHSNGGEEKGIGGLAFLNAERRSHGRKR